MKSWKNPINQQTMEEEILVFEHVNSACAMLSTLQHVYLLHVLDQRGRRILYDQTLSQAWVASAIHRISAEMLTYLRAVNFLKLT